MKKSGSKKGVDNSSLNEDKMINTVKSSAWRAKGSKTASSKRAQDDDESMGSTIVIPKSAILNLLKLGKKQSSNKVNKKGKTELDKNSEPQDTNVQTRSKTSELPDTVVSPPKEEIEETVSNVADGSVKSTSKPEIDVKITPSEKVENTDSAVADDCSNSTNKSNLNSSQSDEVEDFDSTVAEESINSTFTSNVLPEKDSRNMKEDERSGGTSEIQRESSEDIVPMPKDMLEKLMSQLQTLVDQTPWNRKVPDEEVKLSDSFSISAASSEDKIIDLISTDSMSVADQSVTFVSQSIPNKRVQSSIWDLLYK